MHFYVHFGELESWIIEVTEGPADIKCDMVCETPTCFLMKLTEKQPEVVAVTVHNVENIQLESLEKAIREVLVRAKFVEVKKGN